MISSISQRGRAIPVGALGLGEDHAAVFTEVILLSDAEIFVQLRPLIGNLKKLCPYIIKGISNIRKKDRLFRIKKGKKAHCQHIIRPYSYKDLGLPGGRKPWRWHSPDPLL